MSAFGARPVQTAQANVAIPASGDVEVADVPSDSISKLSFCSKADYLAASSWNGEVRVYEVASNGATRGIASYSHEGPVLDVTWTPDGTKILSGGADNVVRMFDTATGAATPVARHDAAIKSVRAFEVNSSPMIATASWDKTLKYWDLRQPNPVAALQLAGRCYTMDVVYPMLAVATSDMQIQVINLSEPTKVYRTIPSPLKMQTRVVTCFPKADGFAVASVEGRTAIHWADPRRSKDNYTFRCHRRDESKTSISVYAVNDVQFHPLYETFLTAGSDGTMNIWDRDARVRTKSFPAAPGPISTTAFNYDGTVLAYAVSYDWSKGHGGMNGQQVNKIMLHPVQDEEVKKRQRNP